MPKWVTDEVFKVYWHLTTQTKTEEKARKVTGRFGELLGRALSIASCERYWKDPAQFKVSTWTTIEAATVEQLVYAVLIDLTAVGGKTELGPMEHGDGSVTMDAYVIGSSVPGVEWVHMYLEYSP